LKHPTTDRPNRAMTSRTKAPSRVTSGVVLAVTLALLGGDRPTHPIVVQVDLPVTSLVVLVAAPWLRVRDID
jgi:hypothetical protein